MGKGRRKARSGSRSPGRRPGRQKWLYFGLAALLVIVIGGGTTLVFTRGSPATESVSPPPQETRGVLPVWLRTASPLVREAYAYAVDRPDILTYIPCYCGCGQHDGHRSIHDCFVASRYPDGSVAYDTHGANCDMCVDIALISKRMTAGGESLKEVKAVVVAKYSKLGPPTDTPPIPEG